MKGGLVMSLDKKLKQAALNVALRHIIKNKEKSRERTCRNVIELGKELTTKEMDAGSLGSLYSELLASINQMDDEMLKEWVIQQFEL